MSTTMMDQAQAPSEQFTASESRGPLHQLAQEDPRPTFSLKEGAAILGKSLRALERSLLGKWGNRLPDGWTAQQVSTAKGPEWRIIPPPGFRVRPIALDQADAQLRGVSEDDLLADQARLQLPGRRRGPAWSLQDQSSEHPTIVIDRTDEIERLLNELVGVQKQLSEERRMHIEDLRLLSHLKGSMHLLEVKACETEKVKEELRSTQKEFLELKEQYLALVALPWWKRLFWRFPQRL